MVSVYLCCSELLGAFLHVSCDSGGVLGTRGRSGWWRAAGGPAVGHVVDPMPIMVGHDTAVSHLPHPSFTTAKPNLRKCFLNLSLLSQPQYPNQ